MAKYTITYSCGHTGIVNLFGANKERESKIKFFEEQGLCPECYKAKKQAEEAAKPLTLTVKIARELSASGEILFCAELSGDTKPIKEQIKSLGFRWSEASGSGLSGLIGFERPALCWSIKVVANDNGIAQLQQCADALGATIVLDRDPVAATYAQELKKSYDERAAKIAELKKPTTPTILVGHRWNKTVYGRTGHYKVYLDDEETLLTDEQAAEIKEYVKAKEAYKSAIDSINGTR